MSLLLLLMTASVVGTMLFAILFALKPITEKLFSKSWHYYMSFLPIFFLLGGGGVVNILIGFLEPHLPAATTDMFTGALAPLNTNAVSPNTQLTTPASMPYVEQYMTNGVQSGSELLTYLLGIAQTVEIGFVFTLVWAIGAILYVVVNVQKYWVYRNVLFRESRTCTSMQSPIDVVISKTATTPMLIGFFKPLIVLPDMDFKESELEMILAHELVHFKRKDVWLKLVVLIAKALHWYNPFVCFLNRYINVLCELSCDEKVVMEMEAPQRKLYGETILFMLQHSNTQRNLFCANGLCNSKKNIKRRLLYMLNVKRTKKAMVALSLAATLILSGIGGVIAYGLDFVTSSNESPNTVSVPEFILNVDEDGNPLRPTRIVPDGTELAPGFTWDRNSEFTNSLPTRVIESDSTWVDDSDEPFVWEVFETISDYDPTLMYLRNIMSPELADQLWESQYFEAQSVKMWGFHAFFTSDQFVELLEYFGDGFIEDFLNRDVIENLELLLGDNFDAFLEEAAALDYMSGSWVDDQLVLVESIETFVRKHLELLHGENIGNFANVDEAIQYFTVPTSMVHFPLPERVQTLESEGHEILTDEWEPIMEASEDIGIRTTDLNNRSFMLQHLFEISVINFMDEVM